MSWTAVSDTTDPSWAAPSDATFRSWQQLSKYTLSDPAGDVDFMLVADEQYPLLTYEHDYPVITETGFETP